MEHRGLNCQEAVHSSLYVAPELTERLPRQVCALTVSPLLRALLDELRQHPPALPRTSAQEPLLQVVLDQLERAECVGSYSLPTSGDERPVADWAAFLHTTERTLMRRYQSELGMTLTEWRQRLHVVKAMAQDLGYASTSAFIAMFRRLMGVTPDEWRRGMGRGK